jgi:hypothetical protein
MLAFAPGTGCSTGNEREGVQGSGVPIRHKLRPPNHRPLAFPHERRGNYQMARRGMRRDVLASNALARARKQRRVVTVRTKNW